MARIYRTNKSTKASDQKPSYVSDNKQNDDTIDLLGLFYRLMENLKYILATAFLGAMIMGAVTYFWITPTYETTSKIYVMNSDDAAINLSDFQIGTYLAADYQEVFYNWIVHERVIQALDLPYSYNELSSMLTVTNPTDTRILYITITSEDPQEAKDIADTYAEVAQEFISTTMDTKEPSLFEEALLPTYPPSPSKTKNIAMGFMAGLLLSCGIITIRFVLDDKIRSSEDIENYIGLSTLGIVPLQKVVLPNKSERKRNHKNKEEGGASS